MKVKVEYDVHNFEVPEFVRTTLGVNVLLSMLSGAELDALCDKFRREVFKKANVQQPPQEHAVSKNEKRYQKLRRCTVDVSVMGQTIFTGVSGDLLGEMIDKHLG